MSPLSQSLESGTKSKQRVNKIVENALVNAYKKLNPDVEIYLQGYVKDFQENLLSSVHTDDFVDDLLASAGKELERKFPAIYSSAALVINNFAPFRSQLASLSFPNSLKVKNEFLNLEFEKKCYTGLLGAPPHLDVLLNSADNNVLAVESKFTEILHKKSNIKISPTYFDDVPRIWKGSVYHDELVRIREGTAIYKYLDVPQLIKHSFGLTNTYLKSPESQERIVTLLYLYWEPANIDSLTGSLKKVYEIHADELLKFKATIGTAPEPVFESMSYRELWKHWDQTIPNNLKNHLSELKNRYLISI